MNQLSYLKIKGVRVNYCWNYGSLKLLLLFIEYSLDQLNNKHTKIAVTTKMQVFESHHQNECLVKVWSFFAYPLQALHKKFSMKDSFSKCDQICRKLRIWSHLLKKSFMENFIFCAAKITTPYDFCEIERKPSFNG